MKSWFTSLNGAITLSKLSLLSFIGYVFMEMRYFFEKWIPGEGATLLVTIVVLLIIWAWLRALFVAANGKRSGLIGLFAFSALAILIAIYDMQFVLKIPWPEGLMVVLMLIVGAIATVASGISLKRSRKA